MTPKLRPFFTFIIVLLFNTSNYSQIHEVFDYPSIVEGDNTYLCSNLFIDHNGFIWYATKDWLVKDFGNSKKYIPLKFSRSINLPARVNAFFQDKDANIWVLTSLGIYIINYNDYSVKLLQPGIIENNTAYDVYISIVQQQNGTIWVSTYQNYILEIKNNTLINSYKVDQNTTDRFLLNLNKNDDVVIVGETKVFTIKNNKLEFVADKKFEEIFISLTSPKNNVRTKKGFIQYNDKKIPYSYYPKIDMYKISFEDGNFNTFTANRLNNLNFFIEGNHISTIHKNYIWSQKFEYKNQQWYLKDLFKIKLKVNIQSITEDSFNNYILTSNANQIHKVRKELKFYETYLKDSLSNISTRAIISDSKNNLFVASYAGLFKIDSVGNTQNIANNLYNKDIYTFLRKNDSLIWNSSDCHFRESNFLKNTFHNLEQKEMEVHNSKIRSLAHKNNTQIWIGTTDGLYVFDKKTENFTNYNELNKNYSLKDIPINDILQLPNGQVWFGTSNGAYKYNIKTKKVIHYSNKSKTHKIPHSIVLDIHKDKYNTIWMAGDKGLVSINDKGTTNQYVTKDGLVNNTTCSLIETAKHLWVATYDGISRVTLSENNRQFSNYLKGNEFNHSSSYKLNDSTLVFGSTNGVYKIYTHKVSERHLSQKIIPVSLKTYQKDKDSIIEQFNLKSLKSIKLEYNANYFEFKFALNKTFNHTKNNFSYKIEGLTNSWISLGSRTVIRQYGIPPGKYVLKVKGINEEGMKSINELSIPFTVSQIFYKTTGFILTAILLILASIFLIIYRIKSRYKKEKNLKSDIRELKIKALTMQMNPHFIFNIINNIQSDLILKSTVNINDYIHAFSNLLRTTMNMTTSNTISLKNEIEYLEAYVKLQEYRLNNNFSHKIDVINHTDNTDMDTIKIPCMLLQPIVENAILHGLEPKTDPNKLLKITFTINETIEISIEDNGIGRKKDIDTSTYDTPHAMGLMKTRVGLRNELKKNKITIQIIDLTNNNIPIGTKVLFKIPYK